MGEQAKSKPGLLARWREKLARRRRARAGRPESMQDVRQRNFERADRWGGPMGGG